MRQPVNYGMVLFWLAVAVVGRIFLMPVPSVEPIIPIALLVAVSYGIDSGILVGVLGYLLSNAFTGYFGEWSIFQMIAGGVAVCAIYFRPKGFKTNIDLVWLALIGTVLYEMVINIFGGGLAGSGLLDLEGWMTAIPFSATHIIANVVFATLLSGFVKAPSPE